MSFDEGFDASLKSEERIATALEKISAALELFVTLSARRLELEFPQRSGKIGEINRVDDDKKKEFSDEADPEWFSQTEDAIPSRFQEKLDQQKP